MFDVKKRSDECVHVMLYPKKILNMKIQILRSSANVWFEDFSKLYEIEDLLNRIFRNRSRRKPFEQPKFQLMTGEKGKILETPFGLACVFLYYNGPLIAEALGQIIQNMSTWDQWQGKRVGH